MQFLLIGTGAQAHFHFSGFPIFSIEKNPNGGRQTGYEWDDGIPTHYH
jgi:hypothetical protein